MKVSNLLLPSMPRATIAVIKNFHLNVLFVIQYSSIKTNCSVKFGVQVVVVVELRREV